MGSNPEIPVMLNSLLKQVKNLTKELTNSKHESQQVMNEI